MFQFTQWVDAVIFVFSLENEVSFQSVYTFYAKMAHFRNTAEIPLILVGTQGKNQMSLAMRKPDFCLGENKGTDQLRSHCEADQRLCFRYTDSTIPLLLRSEISSF